MEFSLTEEQQQLQDSLRRYLDKSYTFDARRQQLKANKKFSTANPHWQTFAEFGLLGIGLPESCGGTGSRANIGGSGVAAEDTMIVMSSLGRALAVEPYLATVVLCGSVLGAHEAEPACAALLAEIVTGHKSMALAVHERAGRYQPSHVETVVRRDGDAFVLNGSKAFTLHGDVADTLIVSARTHSAIGDEDGISLFLIDKNTPGLTVRGYATHDGLSVADITLTNVRIPSNALIGAEHQAYATIESAIGLGIVALCAEALGAMEALGEQTLEYLKNRKQFGVAIGTFQVLQHRMVDIFIATEQARSITILAALKATAPDMNERRRVLAAAKSLVGQSARYVGQQAVQLHGGMGVVDELAVSHYFKRLTAIDMMLGDTHYHRAVLGDLLAA